MKFITAFFLAIKENNNDNGIRIVALNTQISIEMNRKSQLHAENYPIDKNSNQFIDHETFASAL